MLHPVEHAAEVDVHDPVVLLGREVDDGRRGADAGDVEDGVEPTELLDGGVDGGGDIGLDGDVAVHRQHAFTDLDGRVLLGAADVGGDHPAPSRTNTLADALAIPEPAPVITATFPSRDPPSSAPVVRQGHRQVVRHPRGAGRRR